MQRWQKREVAKRGRVHDYGVDKEDTKKRSNVKTSACGGIWVKVYAKEQAMVII